MAFVETGFGAAYQGDPFGGGRAYSVPFPQASFPGTRIKPEVRKKKPVNARPARAAPRKYPPGQAPRKIQMLLDASQAYRGIFNELEAEYRRDSPNISPDYRLTKSERKNLSAEASRLFARRFPNANPAKAAAKNRQVTRKLALATDPLASNLKKDLKTVKALYANLGATTSIQSRGQIPKSIANANIDPFMLNPYKSRLANSGTSGFTLFPGAKVRTKGFSGLGYGGATPYGAAVYEAGLIRDEGQYTGETPSQVRARINKEFIRNNQRDGETLKATRQRLAAEGASAFGMSGRGGAPVQMIAPFVAQQSGVYNVGTGPQGRYLIPTSR